MILVLVVMLYAFPAPSTTRPMRMAVRTFANVMRLGMKS